MKKEPPWADVKKDPTWVDVKEQLSGLEINIFSIFHYLVLIALWICLGFFAFDEDYSHAVAIAVIIIAWKMKSRLETQ